MKNINQDTLGFTVVVSGVPSTAAEYDEMAKEVGACVTDAVSNVIYRSWLATFRKNLAKKANELFASVYAWPTKTDDKGKVTFTEKETTYLETLESELAKAVNPATGEPYGPAGAHNALQELASSLAATQPFSLDTTRTGGRIAQEWLDAADQVIEQVTAAGGDFTRFIANITKVIPTFAFQFDDTTGSPTRESVAFALRAHKDALVKQAQAGLLG